MGDIVFLVHRIPFPPDRGDKIRSFHILKKLREIGRVHCACFADDDEDMAHAETLRPMLASLHVEKRTASAAVSGLKSLATGKPLSLVHFASGTMRGQVDRLLAANDIDTIFAFSGQMAQYVPDDLNGRRFVMDFVDMDSAKFSEYAERANAPMRWVYRREAKKLFAFEARTARRADCSLFVSAAETALFRRHTGLPESDVRTLENGIDFGSFDPQAAFKAIHVEGEGPLIVFTGQMDYRPNVEAVTSFARDSFPAIRAARPDARFAIVGRKPVRDVEQLAGLDGVIVTGGVPDIRGWIAAADIIVAPLRMARGIQNKILEAMAMAKPVVASPAAFEGIDAEPGRDLIIADRAGEANAVLDLLGDPDAMQAIGSAARNRVVERYSWASVLAPLDAMLGVAPIKTDTAAAA